MELPQATGHRLEPTARGSSQPLACDGTCAGGGVRPGQAQSAAPARLPHTSQRICVRQRPRSPRQVVGLFGGGRVVVVRCRRAVRSLQQASGVGLSTVGIHQVLKKFELRNTDKYKITNSGITNCYPMSVKKSITQTKIDCPVIQIRVCFIIYTQN